MSSILKAACVQLNNGPNRVENTKTVTEFIRDAAAHGARLICTPEYTCQMVEPGRTSRLSGAQGEDADEQLGHYRKLAADLGAWILVGSLGVKVAEDRIANRSYLLNDKGEIAAKYDKIHLFDVDLPDGKSFRESSVVRAGDRAVVAATPWGGLGMTICYDVRFAYLHRALAKAGAMILSVPSAYSIPTGKTTWEIYLRTRAAETGSFVLAPAQVGLHEGTRRTWGHSMIIGPVGEILAEADGETPGLIMADLDLAAVAEARRNVPSLTQDRTFAVESQVEPEQARKLCGGLQQDAAKAGM